MCIQVFERVEENGAVRSAFRTGLIRILRRVAFAVLAATACSPTAEEASGVVSTRLAGHAFLTAPAVDRPVSVFDGAGDGALIATTRTDEGGAWSLELGLLPATLRVEVAMTEGATSEPLVAIVDDLELGTSRADIQVTAVTLWAAKLGDALTARGLSEARARSDSGALLHAHLGGLDHAHVRPVDVQAVAAPVATEEVVAGILLASLEVEAEQFRTRADARAGDVTAAGFVSSLAEDLGDGVLDGLGATEQPLTFAGVPLGADTLRVDYAAAVAAFLDGPRNATAFRSSDFRSLLDAIRTNESELFPRGSASGRDTRGPEIVRARFLDPDGEPCAEGRPLSGRVLLDAEARDESGVASIAFVGPNFGAVEADILSAPESARFPIVTESLGDGARTFELVLTDTRGNETRKGLEVLVDNTPPVLTLTGPSEVGTATLTVEGTWSDAVGPVTVELAVEGLEPIRLADLPAVFHAVVGIPCGRPVRVEGHAIDGVGHRSAPAAFTTACRTEGPTLALGVSEMVQEGDLLVERFGASLLYTPQPNARRVQIREAAEWPLRFEKYFTRLDAASPNLPVLRFLPSDGVVNLAYRYLVDDVEQRPWTTLSLDEAGDYALPLSYATLGKETTFTSSTALHAVEVRAEDSFGRAVVRRYPFSWTILSPPIWVTGCGPANHLTWADLGALFTTPDGEGEVATGTLEYPLDLQRGSLATLEPVELVAVVPAADSRIVALSEEKFAPPDYGRESTTPPWGAPSCARGHIVWDDGDDPAWTCARGTYLDDHVFTDVATATAPATLLSDPNTHRTRVVTTDKNGVPRGTLGAGVALPTGEVSAFGVWVDSPRLSLGGVEYGFPTTFAAAPADYVSQARTTGRYRVASPTRHGFDIQFVRSEPDVIFPLLYYRYRPFVTRPAISGFELRAEPVRFTARHPRLGIDVAVREAPECLQTIVQSLAE